MEANSESKYKYLMWIEQELRFYFEELIAENVNQLASPSNILMIIFFFILCSLKYINFCHFT